MTVGKYKNYILFGLIFLSLAGFFDSLIVHFKISSDINAPCIIFTGCNDVIFSQYSNFFGIPLSYWGMSFYLILSFIFLVYLISKKQGLISIAVALSFLGFLFSLYLFYVQIMVIESLCSYCLVSFLVSTLIVHLALKINKNK